MSGLNHNLETTHSFINLEVEGNIPIGLDGTLYRVGPGLVERFGVNVHPFLADGAITAIKFNNDSVKGACRLVKSKKFIKEEEREAFLFDSNASFIRRLYNGITRTVKETGNTNVLNWNNRLFALMEQGLPLEFNAKNLDSIGVTNFEIINGSFSAHPHRVDSLKTTYNYGVDKGTLIVYSLHDNGKINIFTKLKLPWTSLIHDFCVTDKNIIFFIDACKMVTWRAILGLKDFSKYFTWDDKQETLIYIIPIECPDEFYVVKSKNFRVWHFANAYEDGKNIVVDFFKHKNIDVLIKPTMLDSEIPAPVLYRYTISKREKKAYGELLYSGLCEFPFVNPKYFGIKHKYIWMQSYKDNEFNEGITCFNTIDKTYKRWCAPTGHLTSEVIFVESLDSDDELSGHLLQLIQDSNSSRSYLAVFNAESFEKGPVAKVWFKHRIPATFHGTFVRV